MLAREEQEAQLLKGSTLIPATRADGFQIESSAWSWSWHLESVENDVSEFRRLAEKASDLLRHGGRVNGTKLRQLGTPLFRERTDFAVEAGLKRKFLTIHLAKTPTLFAPSR